MSRFKPLARNALHLFALCGLAVAKPLYDLIETDPSSLAVNDVTGAALVVMALVMLLLPPLLLLAVEALALLAGEPWLKRTHVLLVGALAALFVLQARTAVGLLPDGFVALAPIALVAGALFAWLYAKVEVVRTYLSVLAVAPLLFIALFLFNGAASPLVTEVGEVGAAPGEPAAGAPPVVFVILDELPLWSLLDSGGRIDAERFPNFARVAGDATWFRNTTSVEAFTPWAIPAILTGRYPRERAYSLAAFHPNSLFTLFGGSHDLHVYEAFTRVCPEALCPRREGNVIQRAFAGFDGLVLPFWMRLVPGRPGEYAGKATQKARALLGANTQVSAPGDTAQAAELRVAMEARVPDFEAFVSELGTGEQPSLHYAHVLFPHAGFDYQREGRYELRGERMRDDIWDPDPSLAALGLRRHLLQVEFTDRLLGRLLDRLQETGLYDEAALVLVADHGAYFVSGANRRVPNRRSLPFLAPVPFFLKSPGQTDGRIDDTPAETVDVLPTLADAIGIELPWEVDGRSLLDDAAGADRDTVRMTFQGRPAAALPRAVIDAGRPVVRERLPFSGEGDDRRPLFAEAGFAELVGARVPDDLPEHPDLRVAFDDWSGPLAAQGTVTGGDGRRVVAVAACERIAAVARTYRDRDRERFAAVLDPSISGDCPLELVLVEGRRPVARIPR